MRVLVTRAEPAASGTRLRLEALGHEPVLLPIFELVDIGGELPDLDYEGVIFPSANAVEVLARRNWHVSKPNMVAYCVGRRTAEAAQGLGFRQSVVASGGGAVLCKEIKACDLPKRTRLLYPTTPDRSFDMAVHLKQMGLTVDSVDVYQMQKNPLSGEAVPEAVNQCKNGAILIYSARSADYLSQLIDSGPELSDISSISLVGISNSATNIMLKYPWQNVYVSSNPNEEAMMSLLEAITSA